MPRRERPAHTERSEHWLRVMVNERTELLNDHISNAFGWTEDVIEWQSPVESDDYAEYYDHEFLDCLGVEELVMPLEEFWPKSGPRWDGLARTRSKKLILVEAKAHIEEAVDFQSKASSDSLRRIEQRLDEAKSAFRAYVDACWYTPFYQMANRLAHLYYLAELNGKDAYLVFLNFANAPDVPHPASYEEWNGATRLARKCLGMKDSKLSRRVATITVDLSSGDATTKNSAYAPYRTADSGR